MNEATEQLILDNLMQLSGKVGSIETMTVELHNKFYKNGFIKKVDSIKSEVTEVKKKLDEHILEKEIVEEITEERKGKKKGAFRRKQDIRLVRISLLIAGIGATTGIVFSIIAMAA